MVGSPRNGSLNWPSRRSDPTFAAPKSGGQGAIVSKINALRSFARLTKLGARSRVKDI
jgi:hypothetical protein